MDATTTRFRRFMVLAAIVGVLVAAGLPTDGAVRAAGADGSSYPLTCTPADLSVAQGSAVTTSCIVEVPADPTVEPEGALMLSCQGLPVGVQCFFEPNVLLPLPGQPAQATMTLAAGATAPAGSYPFDVVAVAPDGDVLASAPMRLLVDLAQCECEVLSIKPAAANAAVKGEFVKKSKQTEFDIQVDISWARIIQCTEDDGTHCEDTPTLAASSSGWSFEQRKGGNVAGTASNENHTPMDAAAWVCKGPCDGKAHKLADAVSTYTVRVARTDGEKIKERKLTGVINVTVTPSNCPGSPWTASIAIEIDPYGKGAVDNDASDWDGDGLNGAGEKKQKTDPLDPDSDNDGANDSSDTFPHDPNKQ